MLVFKLSWGLLLSEALPAVALQLKSGLVCEYDIFKTLILIQALFTPCKSLLLVEITNCLTISCRSERGGPPTKVPEAHYRCIDDAMTHDDELTASSLKDILKKKFGAENVKYGTRTIARLRNELGWTLGWSHTLPVAHHLEIVFPTVL